MTSSCDKASYKGHGEQEKEFIILYEGGMEKSPSLWMPISDPRDRFFHPTITLMINSYILIFRDEISILTHLAYRANAKRNMLYQTI